MNIKKYIGLIVTLITIIPIWLKLYYLNKNQNNYLDNSMQRIILIFGDNNFHIQIERIAIASYYVTKNTKFIINNKFIDNIDIYMDHIAIVLDTSTVIDTVILFNNWLKHDQYLLNSKLDIIIICNDTDIEQIAEMNYLYYNGTNNLMKIVSVKI